MTLTYGAFLVFLLVLTRMTGALVLNPILGRKAVPAILKVGLALIISIVIFPTLQDSAPSFPTPLAFMLALVREIVIGYALGLIVNLLIAALLVGGEIMDMEMGASVAKIYDPQSNVSMPLTGTALNVMLTLIFFSTNGHLTLIKLVAESFQMFPPGPTMIAIEVGRYISAMLGDVLVLALKIAMPVMTIELLTEAGLGVLMRIVPQINIFVVGIQIKLGIGIMVVILALPTYARLLDAQMPSLFEQLENGIRIMLSTG